MQETVEIPERLDALPPSWFHRKLLLVCGFGYFFDQMDLQVLGTAITAIAAAWKLSSVETGLTLSAGYLGLFVGASTAGLLSDYIGRKRVFQITLLFFAVLTGLASLSQNVAQLIVFRLLIGLGLGGELPVVASLVSEFIPKNVRGKYLSLLNGFNAFGALTAAFIGVLVVPYSWGPLMGWQLSFLIGALPALYVWWVRRGIPESPRWLEARGRRREAMEVVAEIDGGAKQEVTVSPQPKSLAHERSPFRELFAGKAIRRTLLAWVTWFCLSWVFYAILVWLPSLLVDQGFTVLHSLQLNLFLNIMGIPGFLAVSYLIERAGRKKILVGFITLNAGSIFLWGHSTTILEVLLWGSLMYFSAAGMMTANASYTAELFPTGARGTGLGLATAWGRISSFLGIISVGLLIASIGVSGLYTFYTVLMAVPIVAIVLVGTESRGRSLEAISA